MYDVIVKKNSDLGGIILGNYLTTVGDGARGKLVAAMLI